LENSGELNSTIASGSGEEVYAKIRKNSFYTLLERILVPAFNFFITVFIIRQLTIGDYGIYNILIAIMGYIALLSSLGLPGVFRRFIPEFYQKKEIAKIIQLVKKGMSLRFIISGGIILLLLFFSSEIGQFFKFSRAFQYLAVFSIGIVFYMQALLLKNVMVSMFLHKQFLISQLIYVIFRASILYILLALGKGLLGLLIGESIVYVLLYMLFQFFYLRFLKKQPSKDREELPRKRLLRFGGLSYFNEVGEKILAVSTDFFIISVFLGPEAVGIYGFATWIMTIASRFLPHTIFINIIRPLFFAQYIQKKDPEWLKKMFILLVKITAFFSLPLVANIFILGDKLIYYVFDPKYLKSLTVLWIVAGFFTVNYLMTLIELVLQSIEKVQILFYSKIFAVYNLILDLLVVKAYGIIGIAIVTCTAVLFKNIFCYFYARKYISLSFDIKNLGKIASNSLVMAVPIFLLRNYVQSVISLVIVIMIGVFVYFVISSLNKSFSHEEKRIINRILPKPVFIF